MSDPVVCCVMLTRDRPAMARRAVECFRAQTYERKGLLVLDNGACTIGSPGHNVLVVQNPAIASIGKLRNHANMLAPDSEIIVHWDDDDWSHPSRLAEQVALLKASTADAVGYNEVLFWDSRERANQAWLYTRRTTRYAIGSSLCYWRRVWEQHRFLDLPEPGKPDSIGEDTVWLAGVTGFGVSSLIARRPLPEIAAGAYQSEDCEPRMICSIHGANTQSYRALEIAKEFSPAPQWSELCERTMR